MPVQIQCTSVVIRNDALDRVLDGGSKNFAEIAPNAMSYSDDRLSQASFMSPVDAEEFAKDLELRGLQRDAESPDFVIVQSHDHSVEPPCDWLILFEYEQRLIATIRGSDSRTVVAADIEHDPDAVQHYSAEEIEQNFEFVERKDNIDTYREKATGKLVYSTRTTENDDEIFKRAFQTVFNLRRDPGRMPRQGEEAATIRTIIGQLQSLAGKYPDNAKVGLALGLAWFAIGKDDNAKQQLMRAAKLDPEETTILKELGGVCLTINDLPTATDAATKAVTIAPDDTDLLCNLAVIQLISGQVVNAKNTIARAIELQPDDSVNKNVHAIITSVATGKRPCPTTLHEMMRTPKKRKSWLARLLGR